MRRVFLKYGWDANDQFWRSTANLRTAPKARRAYRMSPTFDEQTLPAALQKRHRTEAGAWAPIHVVEGRILHRILEPFGDTVLTPGESGVVRPEQSHELQLPYPVRLFVEFFAPPATQARRDRLVSAPPP